MSGNQRRTGIPEAIGKEWMSLAYLRAICAQTGLNTGRHEFDNGIDVFVGSIKPMDGIANANLFFQLKSTCDWQVVDDTIKYDLPVKNYDQLRRESVAPQYLVLFTLPEDCSSWVKYQYDLMGHKHVIELRHMAYFLDLKGFPATENEGTIRVSFPVTNQFTAEALLRMYSEYVNGWNSISRAV